MEKKIKVRLKGKSPLLMHRYPIEMEGEAIHKLPIEEQAEIAAYRVPDTKELYVPGHCIQRALINAGIYTKRGRGSLMKEVAASVFVTPEYIVINADGKVATEYKIDVQPANNPTTKGKMKAIRPRFDEWEIEFDLEYDQNLMSEKEVRKIVDDMGSRVGLLSFRPQKKGSFGRCFVTLWEPYK